MRFNNAFRELCEQLVFHLLNYLFQKLPKKIEANVLCVFGSITCDNPWNVNLVNSEQRLFSSQNPISQKQIADFECQKKSFVDEVLEK